MQEKFDMYPSIEPYETGYIDVGGGHELYYELCGNPEGIPAVYLHGGPGPLGHIPCFIIHGRYDLICPVENAFALHSAWPGSVLHVLPQTGHTMREPNIVASVVETTNMLAKKGKAAGSHFP